MTTVRVLGWDDPRGRDPLEAAAREFERRMGTVSVQVFTRSLAAFEDQPIEAVARGHDVIGIDHPFVGEAASHGLFVPLDTIIDAEWLGRHRADCVGPTFASYTWAGHQWAFAIDAACQVSAWRADLLDALSVAPPQDPDSVIDLARAHPGRVALALNPIHAACSFMTLCAGVSPATPSRHGIEIPTEVGEGALAWMRELARLCHPMSRSASPIAVLEAMSSEADGIAYSPMIFGYSNYSRGDYRAHRITFGNIPSPGGEHRGAILGGVGLAVSASSPCVPEAVEFAAFVASPGFQRDGLLAAGGQPASRRAWDDPYLDATVGGFFSGTRPTIERAFLRPRFPGFHRRQHRMAELIHGLVWDHEASPASISEVLAMLATPAVDPTDAVMS
jgi:multiple sugar transport system substrate-binding protein